MEYEHMEHILAFPVSLPGHMIPMLNLCGKIASLARGSKKITILINEDKVETLAKLQQHLEENGGSLPKEAISIEALPIYLPPAFTGDDQIQLLSQQLDAIAVPASLAAKRITSESTTAPVTCILSDLLLGWSYDIAKEIGVPCIALSIIALAEPAVLVHMISNDIHDFLRDKLTQVPGLPPLEREDIPRVSQHSNSNFTYWNHIRRQYSRIREAKYVLINSCYELEKESHEALVDKLPLRFVGPLLTPAARNPSESTCIDWLDRKGKHSVVYISFGSMLQWESSELEDIVSGVEESGYNFLLAFRDDVLVDQASPALTAFLESYSPRFTEGGRELEPGSLAKQGLVVSWAPQVDVLSHASTGGFFTHYGWNSVSESISSGVPLMGKPSLGDQFLMRKMVIDKWRNGVKIEEDVNGCMSKSAVREAVIQLMEDKVIRKNASELKQAVSKGVKEGDENIVSVFDIQR